STNNISSLIRSKIKNINNYENAIERSIIQSNNFINIENRDQINYCDLVSNQKINFGDRSSLVNPVLVSMFGIKLPILEQLAIRNDTLELMDTLSNINKKSRSNICMSSEDKINFNNNETLLKFRLSDPNLYMQGFNKINNNNALMESETKRILNHCLLRMAVMDMRDGKFNSNYNNCLNDNIRALDINYPDYTMTQKGYFESIIRL